MIPAVDVLGGKVVRLLRGDYRRVKVYADDPVAQARHWMEAGAPLVHVVDLEGARSGEPSVRLWESMAAAGIRFQVGGGIRDAVTARRAIEAGALRVVMGTAAVWSPEVISQLGDLVVAAVDVRGGRATGSGWADRGREIGAVLNDLAGVGVGRVLLTGISRDGTMSGPDLGLTERVVKDGRFRVLASGGVGRLEDLVELARLGCEGAVVGKALYEGKVDLGEALKVGERVIRPSAS